jgi:hypothetical protein
MTPPICLLTLSEKRLTPIELWSEFTSFSSFSFSFLPSTHSPSVPSLAFLLTCSSFSDDVPQEVKLARLQEVIELFYSLAEEKNKTLEKGKKHLVLIEKVSFFLFLFLLFPFLFLFHSPFTFRRVDVPTRSLWVARTPTRKYCSQISMFLVVLHIPSQQKSN